MCAPTQTSSNYGPIGTVRNYSPAKQKRFEAEVAKTQQKLQDAGYTPSGHAFDPFGGGPMSAMGEMIWAMKDAEKYPEISERDPAYALNQNEEQNQGTNKRLLKIKNQSSIKIGNRKSKLNKSGGSGSLRKPMKTLNT